MLKNVSKMPSRKQTIIMKKAELSATKNNIGSISSTMVRLKSITVLENQRMNR